MTDINCRRGSILQVFTVMFQQHDFNHLLSDYYAIKRSLWNLTITLIQDDLITTMIMAMAIAILIVHYYHLLLLVINVAQGFILLVGHQHRRFV